MHNDAELHRLTGGSSGILCRNCRLHCNRTLQGIDRAGEVSDDAITDGVEDAAAVRGDQSVDDGTAGHQLGVGRARQPAVAGNVGRKNRCELSFEELAGHLGSLPISLYRRAA
jgi:hypothetical protein